MSMLTLERDRPVREPDDPRRAAAARRALSRWVLRLAVREWKQRILIVLLITVATAATLFAIAVASATPGTPNAGIYGTAQTLVQLPGNTPDLPGVDREDREGLRLGERDLRPADRHRPGRRRRPARPGPERPVHARAARARLGPLPDSGRPGRGHLGARPALRAADRLRLARPGFRGGKRGPCLHRHRHRREPVEPARRVRPRAARPGRRARLAAERADLPRGRHGLGRRVGGRQRHPRATRPSPRRSRRTPSPPRRRSC